VILIIDEWLWHDLAGENGEERQKEAFEFLMGILRICDRIAVMENSPFVNKFWDFSKVMDSKVIKLFKNGFLHNSDKCRLCEYTDSYTLPGIKPDDLYLYNLYCILEEERCVITTDRPLIEVFKKEGLKAYHRDEFLSDYLRKCSS